MGIRNSSSKKPGRPRRRVLPLLLGILVAAGISVFVPISPTANADTASPTPATATPSAGDEAVTGAVQAALASDGFDASALQVETLGGVVTISGSAQSLLSRERAVDVAEHVPGVRSVSNDIDVAAAPRTDEAITADVVAALRGDRDTQNLPVVASTTDAVVTLTGTVDSWQQRDMVEDVVSGVYGVEGLTDNIALAAHAQRADDAIRSDVESALQWNRLIDASQVHVAVNDGTVALTGTIDSAAERSLAIDSAWVTGVRQVDGRGLEVAAYQNGAAASHPRASAHHSDAEIAGAITDAMRLDARVPADAFGVHVSDGVVTMSGHVETLRAKREAEQVATNVVGVTRIENDIAVKPNTDLTDAAIKAELDEALARDPWVRGLGIETSVFSGVATMRGEVNTQLERTEADWVATGVIGVRDVINDLTEGSQASTTQDHLNTGPRVAQQNATSDAANPPPVTM